MNKNKTISFRLVAFTDAAGKYSPEAFRSGNEDNFFVDDDLTDDTTNKVAQDEILQLGEFGMLMAVADGMGGMNAGEIASQIAVDTVKAAFNRESLSNSSISSAQDRQKFLENVIKQADKNIKLEARRDRSKEGMGSTIILGWLFNDELTISWCGDSRAYIFNEKSGIRLISQDHSYVQELVNKGMLTYDQTFDHPQNNIITRSLGDPANEAKPESKTLKVGKGDIILLCSDGLSGVLRDRKTYGSNGQLFPEENLEDIIKAHTSSMKECREALWAAAERGGWYDNVTAILCQITDGPESPWSSTVPDVSTGGETKGTKKIWIFSCITLVVLAALAAFFFLSKNRGNKIPAEQIKIDSIVSDSILTPAENPIEKEEVEEESKSIESESEKENEKPSVKEQIKNQAEKKVDTLKTKTSELTKIEKKVEEKKVEEKGEGILTRIKNKSKEEPLKDPITPTNPKEEKSTDNTDNKK